ncbi:MAG: SDR family oxidoreductase [Pseudomonadota bacterium]
MHLKGPFRLMALVGERMAASAKGGSIVNLSSTGSIHPSPGAAACGADKASLNALTTSFAHAYGPNIRVHCILARPFLTDISKAWNMEAFEARAKETRAIPRGGDPTEIVGAALSFASRYQLVHDRHAVERGWWWSLAEPGDERRQAHLLRCCWVI